MHRSKRGKPQRLPLLAMVFVLVLLGAAAVMPPLLAQSADDINTENVPEDELKPEVTQAEEPGDGLPTFEQLRDLVTERLAELKDVSGVVTLVSYSGNGPRQAELEVQAVLPSVVRATFLKPDWWIGSVFVLDHAEHRLYQYTPVYDMVQCSVPEQFLAQFGINLDIERLFGVQMTDDLANLEVVRMETRNGIEHAVVKGIVPESLEESIDTVQESVQGALGNLGVDVNHTVYLWVDMENLVVTKFEDYSPDGKLVLSMDTRNVRLDTGLTASGLKNFRRADVHPSCRF